MRSDAIDQLLSTYLKMPAKVSWNGAVGDSVRGVFEGGRVELSGISVAALPCDRLIIESDRFQLTPGIPARIQVTAPRVEISIDQRQLDLWLARARTPFSLTLEEDSIGFQLDVAGFPVSRTRTEIGLTNGWLTLKPQHAEFFGRSSRLARLFRGFLPVPRLAPQTRMSAIRHAAGALRFELALEDIEDEITPGLIERLNSRFLPFARRPGQGAD